MSKKITIWLVLLLAAGILYFPVYQRHRQFTIAVGGTVVLARGVMNLIEANHDPFYPWQGVANIFQDADYAIVNLKSPLVADYQASADRLNLCGKTEYAAGLAKAGIDLVSIAGNHINDGGKTGITDTAAVLDKYKIAHSGAGEDKEKSVQPIFFKIKNIKFGFLGVNKVGKPRTTVAWLDEKYLELVRKTKQQVDCLIVMPNWGQEYRPTPDAEQEKWAGLLIENGADIIVGDQAHWVQTAEYKNINKKPVFVSYGLGNLIFDQKWSKNTREGVIFRFGFSGKKLQRIERILVYLGDDWLVRPVGKITCLTPDNK